MRIQFDYEWANADQTIMRYSARGNWTWKDYHAVLHVSQFVVSQAEGPVHVLIDFSSGAPGHFPGGLAAHAQTFGKRHNETFSGKAVVIGVPVDQLARLGVTDTRTLPTKDGQVRFVDSEAEAQHALQEWA